MWIDLLCYIGLGVVVLLGIATIAAVALIIAMVTNIDRHKK